MTFAGDGQSVGERFSHEPVPPDPSSHINAAWAAFHRRDWDTALVAWARVRERFPHLMIGYAAAMTTLRESGRLEEAAGSIRQWLQEFPDESSLYLEQAWLLQDQGQLTASLTAWKRIQERFASEWVSYLGLSRTLDRLGRDADADAALADGAELFPGEPTLQFEYARAPERRQDWQEAVHRWEQVRRRLPANPASHAGYAHVLRELGDLDSAEAALQDALESFPNDVTIATERAWLSFIRHDWPESVRRWHSVRERFPDLVSGYVAAAKPLMELGRYQDAQNLLIYASLRFPADFAPALEMASLCLRRRDWALAADLFAVLRARFPNQVASYGGGMLALRELGRIDEAEAVAVAAIDRFPTDIGLRIDQAWLAQVAQNWPVALERWAAIRAIAPHLQDGYMMAARALQGLWRHDDADALLTEAIQRFPQAEAPAADYAWNALQQNRLEEASLRFEYLRGRFPAYPDGWLGGAQIFRSLFDLEKAEALLEDAMIRFPDLPQLRLNHAQMPIAPVFAHQKNWPEALRRLDVMHQAFPRFEAGLLMGVRLLKAAGYPDRAESLAASATERLPESVALAIQFSEAAEDRADWDQARQRYGRVRECFAEHPDGDVGLARVLVGQGQLDEAEELLRQTITQFPDSPAPYTAYAELAGRRGDWAMALTRWTDAVRRFPRERDFQHRLYETRMRWTDSDPEASVAFAQMTAAPMPDPDSADPDVRDLVMQFESLGGRGLGCEFGIFQRDCGAEPLGLLRWADMPYDMLVPTLRNRFEGVGLADNTELFVSAVGGGRGEYCTRDRRGMMFMRTFVFEDQAPSEKMQVSALNRLRFLTRKLIEDLEQGTKIFVFRVTDRNLTDSEINELHSALRMYGDNTLLYVRYEDEAHCNGTVVLSKPGLMIGYIDRFKMAMSGELFAAPPTASWLGVCRNAFALWRESKRDD